MPELPEVETIKYSLTSIIGKRVVALSRSHKKFRLMPCENFKDFLINKTIEHISRRSKYLLIHFSEGKTLIIHLGMSGRLMISPEQVSPHDHLELFLSEGMRLVFTDPRRFGLYLLEDTSTLNTHMLFSNLGVEPLTDDFHPDYLYHKLHNKLSHIKTLIMDSSIVVGVGNIYASESLFHAGISPFKRGKELTKKEVVMLCKSIKKILLDAIQCGGSTLRDYVRSNGDIGSFQHQFQVYGRDGKDCYKCSETISNHKINNRSTFYCRACQK